MMRETSGEHETPLAERHALRRVTEFLGRSSCFAKYELLSGSKCLASWDASKIDEDEFPARVIDRARAYAATIEGTPLLFVLRDASDGDVRMSFAMAYDSPVKIP